MRTGRPAVGAAGLLWILDAANNVTMEPYRAYVSDRLLKEHGLTRPALEKAVEAVRGHAAGRLAHRRARAQGAL